MIVHDIIQGSEEWLALRRGIPTASNASMLVSNTGRVSSQIVKYARKMAAELNGVVFNDFSNGWTDRGSETEPEARSNYSLDFAAVSEVGFITNDDQTFGYSPDGFVGDDGLIEIKCVNYDKHCDLMVSNKYPVDYNAQIQAGLWVTGRKWCDLVLYYPGVPMIVHRVVPDSQFHSLLEIQLSICLNSRDDFLENYLSPVTANLATTETKIDF